MKRSKIIGGILLLLILIYSFWKFSQGFDTPKMNYWTQEQMDTWVKKIALSSNHLSGMDSLVAYEIGSCVTKKIIETYSYKETMKLSRLSIDSQMTVIAQIVKECKLTLDFQDITVNSNK